MWRRGARSLTGQSTSTVFALSSGQGRCGVAVIRVTGPASASALLTLTGEGRLPVPRRAVVRSLYSPDAGLLDRALLLWLPGPRSFTGEDCAELHTHGGPAVVAAVLRALSAVPGLRPAAPGDFTRRAFAAGKMDVTQVEGLADLIHAETEQQRRQAVRQADGQLRRLYDSWRAQLLSCLAAVEAYIDFSEEEQLEPEVLRRAGGDAAALVAQMRAHLKDGRRGERLRSGVQVTIAGAPNAGKSSLLNELVQREAAIVSPVPGTTRDTLDTVLDVAGFPVLLTDTAGLRDSEDAVEREGVRRARRSADTSDLLLVVVDARHVLTWLRQRGPARSLSNAAQSGDTSDGEAGGTENTEGDGTTDAEAEYAAFLVDHMASLSLTNESKQQLEPELSSHHPAVLREPEVRLVLNKADLLSPQESALLSRWRPASLVSCLRGDGLPALVASLEVSLQDLCAASAGDSPQLTRERHRHHVAAAARELETFLEQLAAAGEGGDLALAAEQVRRALRELGYVTGHVSAEHVLDVIFRDFCIGK